MTDALELFTDVQFGAIEVNLIPGQAEDFALAQAEDEHQDEGRVQRLARVPGRLEEPARVIDCPRLELATRSRRAGAGSRHGISKLTEGQIPAIRAASANGETQKDIAARFGVSQMTISLIVRRKYWSHVP